VDAIIGSAQDINAGEASDAVSANVVAKNAIKEGRRVLRLSSHLRGDNAGAAGRGEVNLRCVAYGFSLGSGRGSGATLRGENMSRPGLSSYCLSGFARCVAL